MSRIFQILFQRTLIIGVEQFVSCIKFIFEVSWIRRRNISPIQQVLLQQVSKLTLSEFYTCAVISWEFIWLYSRTFSERRERSFSHFGIVIIIVFVTFISYNIEEIQNFINVTSMIVLAIKLFILLCRKNNEVFGFVEINIHITWKKLKIIHLVG